MAISRADLLDMLEPGLMHLFHGGCPTSKEQAKREGAKSYYDDRRCRNGHYAMKKLNGHCERCIKEKKKLFRRILAMLCQQNCALLFLINMFQFQPSNI